MVVPTPNKTIKEEIKDLEFQKQELIKEIDSLEKKLKITYEMQVKGDVTLQCGTQTRIEPQFHLKLDPQQRIEYAAILAVFDGPGLSFGDTQHRSWNGLNLQGYGRWGPLRFVPLWERNNRMSVD